MKFIKPECHVHEHVLVEDYPERWLDGLFWNLIASWAQFQLEMLKEGITLQVVEGKQYEWNNSLFVSFQNGYEYHF